MLRSRLNYPSWPRPLNHWSATGPRNQQSPSRTRERNGTVTRALLTYIGQVGEHHRSDRSLFVKPENFYRRPLHRLGWCSSLVIPVQDRKPQIQQTVLPSSKLTQTRNSSNTEQQGTHQNVHPRKSPQGLALVRPVSSTGQTG
jgi:hypothetical protein